MGPVNVQPGPSEFPPSIEVPSRAFGKAEIALYGDLTDHRNPIHTDQAFASRTPFGKPIVFGFLFIMPIWPALTAAFGPDALSGADMTIRFLAPVFVGQTVHYTGRLLHTGFDRLTYEFTISSEPGNVASIITATLATISTCIAFGACR